MTRLHLAAALVLAIPVACGEDERAPLSDEEFTRMAEGVPIPVPENPNAEAVDIRDKNEAFDFRFAYPQAAAAIPRLKLMLDSKVERAKAEIQRMARDEADMRAEMSGNPTQLYSHTVYEIAGNSRRLLSLLGTIETYTGGAHGNRGTVALLWDRVTEKPVDSAVLFGNADVRDGLLKTDWCEKLEAARRARIGDVPDDSMFDACPDLDAITIIPVDGDEKAGFDTLRLIADPYVAGAYAEGDYRIDIPITQPIRTAITEPYREAFGQ